MTNNTTKITKKDNFLNIVSILTDAGHTDLANVIKQGDALRDAVAAVLTSDLCTIADITAKVNFDGATTSQVQYRLNSLVTNGVAVKEQVTVGDGDSKRKLMGYKLSN